MVGTVKNKIKQELFFCFCEGTNLFHVGDSEISVIKVEGGPCDGKRKFKWPLIGLFYIGRLFLRRKLVECPNNVLLWSADFKFRIYFVKLTSKFGKIRLLDDPGGQGSSPKDFICKLVLSNGLGFRPRKEKSRFGCFWNLDFWTEQWAFENSTFSPLVHRNSRPADGQKLISFLYWFQPSWTLFFWNFWKIFFQ
jgi:hypothetical protein